MSIIPAISAGASLLSAASGLFGGGDKTPRYFPYFKMLFGPKYAKAHTGSDMLAKHEANMFSTQMRARMESAKELGIHPTVALGFNSSTSSPAIQAFGKSAPDYGAMGQDISRAASAFATREARAMEATSAKLQIENQGLQNEMLRQQILQLKSPGGSPGWPSSNQLLPGQGDSTIIPRSIWLRDRDGKLTEVLNPDAGDTEFLQAQDYFTRTMPQDFAHMARRSYDNILSFFKGKKGYNSYTSYRGR